MKKEQQEKKQFIATVEESKMDKIQEIAQNMEKEGVQIDQVLMLSGIITGKAPDLETLKQCKPNGIETIEEARETRAL